MPIHQNRHHPSCLTAALLCLLALFAGSNATASIKTPVETVDFVDLNRYLGTWFEVASIPQSFQKQCVGNTTAEYAFAEQNRIRVVNSCDTADGSRSVSEGRARIEDSATNAKLKVTFVKIIDWVFSFGGDYWILGLAPDYSYALVGDPTAKFGWILSREPVLSRETLISAESIFKSNGYDTCKILTSVQTGGAQKREPLCRVVEDAI